MPIESQPALSVLQNERLGHLTPNERASLAAVVDTLVKRYGSDLLRVVLFGSKARGDFDEESDLDILVVVRMPDDNYWRHWREILDLTYGIDLEYDTVSSLLIRDEPDYAQMRAWNLLLNRNIERDGIELWTAPQKERSFV
ncbi:MAG TPA: nucleotidyltransferase domain-containing protein [Ardenticatenaceae bacterium]|nr:nucleotidyltransferase domain-containing protein [Ardenticatenaceae bacterium]